MNGSMVVSMRRLAAGVAHVFTSTPTEKSARLTQAQIEAFHRDGFLSLTDVASTEEVARLHRTFVRLIRTRAGYREGAQFELTGGSADDHSSVILRKPDSNNPCNRSLRV